MGVKLSISMYITTQLNLYSLSRHPFHNVFFQSIIKGTYCFSCFYCRNALDVVLDMVQYSTSYQMPVNNIQLRLTSAWGETTIILLSVRDSSPAEERDNIRKQKQKWVLKQSGMSHCAVSRQRVRSYVPISSVLWDLICPQIHICARINSSNSLQRIVHKSSKSFKEVKSVLYKHQQLKVLFFLSPETTNGLGQNTPSSYVYEIW